MNRKQKEQAERVAALKAIVDGLKVEETELQARIHTATGEWLEAERDAKRNEPLTTKQREVLELLVKNDASVTESNLYGGERFWVEMPPGSDQNNFSINRNVFYGLLSREAIGGRTYSSALRYTYSLTEHGRLLVNGGAGKGLKETEVAEVSARVC